MASRELLARAMGVLWRLEVEYIGVGAFNGESKLAAKRFRYFYENYFGIWNTWVYWSWQLMGTVRSCDYLNNPFCNEVHPLMALNPKIIWVMNLFLECALSY